MANFFLIDHSLRRLGGHHFDYSRCVAEAANEAGFLTTIGVNRSLGKVSRPDGDSIDRYGNVRRVFRDTTYQRDSYLAGLRHLTRSQSEKALLDDREESRIQRLLNRVKHFRHRQRRESFVKRYATDCEAFFKPLLQMPNDHAFFTTISELELMGLAIYLSRNPQTVQTHWHVQFHFNLFDGRTPEYESQGHTLAAIRACFQAALARIPKHSIKFYVTSETLVEQYQRLGVGYFEPLPYPISPDFAPEQSNLKLHVENLAYMTESSGEAISSESHFSGQPESFRVVRQEAGSSAGLDVGEIGTGKGNDPIRITCPGEVRREKGQVGYLQPLVDDLWENYLATGKATISVQRPAKKKLTGRKKLELSLPEAKPFPGHDPIEYYSHPLDHDAYVDLIRSTDIGLLFYDSRVYFSRRAGVLGELLACGRPVIVPAGSWLAEQFQGPIFEHVESTLRSSDLTRSVRVVDLEWDRDNIPMPGGVLSFDAGPHPFVFETERKEEESGVALEFDWHWPTASGVYCLVELEEYNVAGEVVQRSRQVVGHRRSNGCSNVLFAVSNETCKLRFRLTNAFHKSTATIRNVKLTGVNSGDGGSMPVGKVGLIACDQSDLVYCIEEMIRNYSHYRASAEAFSGDWYKRHDPRSTVDYLVFGDEEALSKVA